jgi:CheY-like chemotaxis protein
MDNGKTSQASLNVLVVDDDMLIQMAMSDILSDLGHASVGANSAEEALTLLMNGDSVDFVITDHAMSGMTGLEFARRLRDSHPGLPVLLATGFEDLPGGCEDDNWPRLRKPFQPDELRVLLERMTGG